MEELLAFAIAHGADVVRDVFAAIEDVRTGKLATAAEIDARFASTHARILAARAKVDADLDARFPTG